MSEPSIFTLSVPIKAYGDEVMQLRLRHATTADARAIGALPYTMAVDDQVPRLVLDVCAKYVARLADVPLSAVDQIAVADFNLLAWEVAGHFLAQGSGDPASKT